MVYADLVKVCLHHRSLAVRQHVRLVHSLKEPMVVVNIDGAVPAQAQVLTRFVLLHPVVRLVNVLFRHQGHKAHNQRRPKDVHPAVG
jgi:hypothetical protein